ncbi:MAG: hypothetical protein H0T79_03495 [Deltaproteobacteria bacterium]|nr:hypothetical protein [Deltaproteobacteria bacterium]
MKSPPKPRISTPTRRAFVGMLGAAIAAIAVREHIVTEVAPAEPVRTPWTGKTRWIGHC